MNPLGLLLLAACTIGLLAAPRRWAAVPLIVGCCYITTGQGLAIGAFALPVFRVLLVVGLLRIILRGERPAGGFNTADWLMIAWCGWTFVASLFQPSSGPSGPKYMLGIIFTVGGPYFIFRALCHDLEDVKHLLRCVCVLLVPVAAVMLYEKFFYQNLFSVFGRVPEIPLIRDGRIRAQGPFSHPILAGTIGAACLPFVLVIWTRYRAAALLGACACLLMVFASASSGPIMSTMFAGFAVGMWRYRRYCGKLRILAVVTYILLMFVMTRPPYYLISRIDLTGSSTGWHRAYLIQQTFAHFDEWALIGTNRTRHWMPDQGHISETETDITNYYIIFGVWSGFLGMLLVLAMLWRAFKSVGEYVRHPATSQVDAFAMWCLGASLFSHATSSISVSYFGQAPVFFWLAVATIASLRRSLAPQRSISPARGATQSLFAPQVVADGSASTTSPVPVLFPVPSHFSESHK